MPTYVNYSSLVSDIQVFLERGDPIDDPVVFNQIPRLINAAERNLIQVLKLLGQVEVLVDTPTGLQINNPVISKPDRWRKTISIARGNGPGLASRKLLFERSYEYCLEYWPNPGLTDPANPPLFYADIDYQHWYVSPTPDQNYPLQVIIYAQPPLLDATNQNNFFTQYCGNALLYRSLVEAAMFLKDDARIQTFGQMWQQEIQTLMAQDLQRQMDRTAERKEV